MTSLLSFVKVICVGHSSSQFHFSLDSPIIPLTAPSISQKTENKAMKVKLLGKV